ncbi:efflux transporter outer membrane subunit [Lampropedia puyangensis]|uniref:Efflux transporter outer membrane subunit n=1 Tax=Lampropedia puyangensis TaxID=1330072 RepID=A0A4S8EXW8_9BURK|nr:efflux transporter outer membrane subunit [Lampropedia puyangensis]THT98483.1 efflux transporter outer membrane subunit [Lampropedia puyangensis]
MAQRLSHHGFLISSIACAMLLQGCANFTSNTTSLSVDVPTQWTRHDPEAATDPVHTAWWKSFNDPTLNHLVDQVLSQNRDLRVAAARVQEARAMADVQDAARWPTLDFSSSAQHSRSISAARGVPVVGSAVQPQFQAAYELDLWGRIQNQRDAAQAQWLASTAAQDSVQLSITATTVSTYLGLRALDARLALAQDTLQVRKQALTLARSREQAGYSSTLDTQQSEAEYHATAQALPQLQQVIARQEHALNLLAGQAPGPVARGLTIEQLQAPHIPALGLPSDLLAHRPDLVAAQEQLIGSDASLAAAKARLLPSVQLTASIGAISSSLLPGDPYSLWNLGGSVLAPLFNGGRLQSMVNASDAQRQQALANYEKAVLTAFSEVEDQLSAVQSTQAQLSEAKAQQEALQKASHVANNRYREGYASHLEALDAQRNLFSAQQTVLQLQADRLIATVNLYKAVGGGWTQRNATAQANSMLE